MNKRTNEQTTTTITTIVHQMINNLERKQNITIALLIILIAIFIVNVQIWKNYDYPTRTAIIRKTTKQSNIYDDDYHHQQQQQQVHGSKPIAWVTGQNV